MIGRFKRYFLNLGPVGATVNLLILGYLLWIAVRSLQGPIGFIILPSILVGLLAPGAFIRLLAPRAGAVLRVSRRVSFACIALILLNMFSPMNLPAAAVLGAMFCIVLCGGVNFWIISDPGIYTQTAMDHMEREIAHEVDMHNAGSEPESDSAQDADREKVLDATDQYRDENK